MLRHVCADLTPIVACVLFLSLGHNLDFVTLLRKAGQLLNADVCLVFLVYRGPTIELLVGSWCRERKMQLRVD